MALVLLRGRALFILTDMKRFFYPLCYLLFTAFALPIYAQSGFINKYDLGLDLAIFSGMLQQNDTTVLYGYGADTSDNPFAGFLIAKIDTLGNIIDFNVSYVYNQGANGYTPTRAFLVDNDGGYACSGNSFFTNEAAIVKFRDDLSSDTTLYYSLDTSQVSVGFDYLQAMPGGYLLGGQVGEADFSTHPIMLKVDANDTLLWQKNYRVMPGEQNVLKDIIKLSDNEYVIVGNTAPYSVTMNTYIYSWMFGIDTSGTVLWEWESDTTDLKLAFSEVIKNGTDGWVAAIINAEWNANGTKYKDYGGITRLNEDKEIVWETSLGSGEPWFTIANLLDLAPTIDGNWVGVGTLFSDSLHAQAAWMVAVSATGDSLWARTDTLRHNNARYSSELAAVVVLPSGSIVAAGSTLHPNTGKYYGLLIKTDPRGCIEADCHPYSISGADAPNDITFRIGPNPTSGLLQVHTGSSIAFSAELYDGAGRVLASRENMHDGDTLDISGVPSGQYFVRIKTAGSSTVVHSVIRI